MKHWSTLFREADGSVSSTRVLMLVAGTVIVGTWSVLCVAHHREIVAAGRLLDIPWSVVTMFGICCGLKLGQKLMEPPAPPPAS